MNDRKRRSLRSEGDQLCGAAVLLFAGHAIWGIAPLAQIACVLFAILGLSFHKKAQIPRHRRA